MENSVNSRKAIMALSPVQSSMQISRELTMAGYNSIERVDYQDALLSHISYSSASIVVLSGELPGEMTTESLLSQIKEKSPRTKIILISKAIEEQTMLEIYFAENLSAWLLSERSERLMSLALEAAESSQLFIDFVINKYAQEIIRENKGSLTKSETNYGNLELLTEREAEVLKFLCDGYNYKSVAKALFISESTVKTHINNVFTKLQVNDRTQAVLYALKHDLEGLMKVTAGV